MPSLLPALCTALFLQAPAVESSFVEVAPVPDNGKLVRSDGQKRAVVLIHGFLIHFSAAGVSRPRFRDWQRPRNLLVRGLARDADVFAFSYGQNASLDDIVKSGGLGEAVARLRKLGYKEIVLLGHSAGGLIARQFVEDNPDAGVTKVVQVCVPNGGTPSANVRVHRVQQVFLDCLTEEGRKACLKARAGKRVPGGVEFVCLLGTTDGTSDTDGVVPCLCQWTADLQQQGIPVVPLAVNHRQATRTERGVAALCRLVREKQPRWDRAQVEKVCKELFKK